MSPSFVVYKRIEAKRLDQRVRTWGITPDKLCLALMTITFVERDRRLTTHTPGLAGEEDVDVRVLQLERRKA